MVLGPPNGKMVLSRRAPDLGCVIADRWPSDREHQIEPQLGRRAEAWEQAGWGRWELPAPPAALLLTPLTETLSHAETPDPPGDPLRPPILWPD